MALPGLFSHLFCSQLVGIKQFKQGNAFFFGDRFGVLSSVSVRDSIIVCIVINVAVSDESKYVIQKKY